MMVPVGGLEPPHISIPDFESGVSTISPHWLKNRMIVIFSLKYSESKDKLFLVDLAVMELMLLDEAKKEVSFYYFRGVL